MVAHFIVHKPALNLREMPLLGTMLHSSSPDVCWLRTSVCTQSMKFILFIYFFLSTSSSLIQLFVLCNFITFALLSPSSSSSLLSYPPPPLPFLPLPPFSSSSLSFSSPPSPQSSLERKWLLKVLVDGLKCDKDHFLYDKHKVFSHVSALAESSMLDRNAKV